MSENVLTRQMTVRRLFGGDWQLGREWENLELDQAGVALDEYGDARGLLYALAKEMGVSVEITPLD